MKSYEFQLTSLLLVLLTSVQLAEIELLVPSSKYEVEVQTPSSSLSPSPSSSPMDDYQLSSTRNELASRPLPYSSQPLNYYTNIAPVQYVPARTDFRHVPVGSDESQGSDEATPVVMRPKMIALLEAAPPGSYPYIPLKQFIQQDRVLQLTPADRPVKLSQAPPHSPIYIPVISDDREKPLRHFGGDDDRFFANSLATKRPTASGISSRGSNSREEPRRERNSFAAFPPMNFRNEETNDREDDGDRDSSVEDSSAFFQEPKSSRQSRPDEGFGFAGNSRKSKEDGADPLSGFGKLSSRDSSRQFRSLTHEEFLKQGADFHKENKENSNNNQEEFPVKEKSKSKNSREIFKDDYNEDSHYHSDSYPSHHVYHTYQKPKYYYKSYDHPKKHYASHHGYRPIPATIHSKHSIETVHKPSKHHEKHNPLVDIHSDPLKLTLRFHTHSSHIQALQHHTGHDGKIHKAEHHVDHPDVLFKTIKKPVIQQVKEIIQPIRYRKQEVRPTVEKIETVIAKDEYPHQHPEKEYEEPKYHQEPYQHEYYQDDAPTGLTPLASPVLANSKGMPTSGVSHYWRNSPATEEGSKDRRHQRSSPELVHSLAQSDNNTPGNK